MTSPNPQDEWTPCPPGELVRLNETMRFRRNRQRRIRAAGVTVGVGCVLLLSVAGINWLKGTGGDMNFGGISCTEVRQHAGNYMAGQVDQETARRIRVHLSECPLCQEYLQDMGMPPGGDAAANPARSSAHLAVAERAGGGSGDADIHPETAPRHSFRSLLTDVR